MTNHQEAMDVAFSLWAKSDHETGKWHALPYHLVDVGAAAACLYRHLPDRSRAIAIETFGDEDLADRVVTFLAAAHDIGKANRFFQGKASEHRLRLAKYGVNREAEQNRHGGATSIVLNLWLAKKWEWKWPAKTNVAKAVGGHHGVFPAETALDTYDLQSEPFASVGPALLNELAELYGLSSSVRSPKDERLSVFLAWLSGFVSVADWLGSHENMCIWRDTPSNLIIYKSEAEVRASKLLEDIRWDNPLRSTRVRIRDLVPAESEPNGLQVLGEEISHKGFRFAIIEAPTGEGKTECALSLCEYGRSNGEGIAFLLPTMATANGLHARFERYLKLALQDESASARLMHSMAWLNKVEFNVSTDDEAKAAIDYVMDWFAGGKRGLIAAYGVGTIDQSLVAVLKAKHGFVRLFALAGKTVVIDEVHAYDVYMGNLIDRLLGWLKALGCNVVLLSATLPTTRRRELLGAWEHDGEPEERTYPCIHWIDESGKVRAESFSVAERKPVAYAIHRVQGESLPSDGADLLLDLIKDRGGLGCLILNTVREAQAAYQHLRRVAPAEIPIELFHARFTAEDRAAKERSVLQRFGKGRVAGDTRILVATQVVEQSLDLDFDHMVSALAPIDLLIQRAGRLHRHPRTANGSLQTGALPDQRPNPTLHIMVPSFSESESPFVTERVYARDILFRTLAVLDAGFVNASPTDVATAIDSVYSEEHMAASRTDWQSQYEVLYAKAEENRQRNRDLADLARIGPPTRACLITMNANGLDEYDEVPGSQVAARTRLEEVPSISLVIDSPHHPMLLNGEYDFATKKALALMTVKTPIYGQMIDALRSLPDLPNKNRSGVSKYAKLLNIDMEGRAAFGDFEALYTPELGLQIKKHGCHL